LTQRAGDGDEGGGFGQEGGGGRRGEFIRRILANRAGGEGRGGGGLGGGALGGEGQGEGGPGGGLRQWRMRRDSEGQGGEGAPRDEMRRLERRISELERIVQRMRDGKDERPASKEGSSTAKPPTSEGNK
jgi:hypothetical protein